jgi:acetyltransferase-like isoleucine patch superfamily enzyme
MLFKIIWFLRGMVYKLFLGRFLLPSYLGKPTYIGNLKHIYIGKNVRIFPGARIEVVGSAGEILIGNNVAIAQNLHLTSGAQLTIGNNVTILANVMITNIDHDYKEIDRHILDQSHIISNTRIGDNCFIGFGAVIQAGTILGVQCVIGANSVVRGIFPDYCVIVGAPARIVKRYDFSDMKWKRTDINGNFLVDFE